VKFQAGAREGGAEEGDAIVVNMQRFDALKQVDIVIRERLAEQSGDCYTDAGPSRLMQLTEAGSCSCRYITCTNANWHQILKSTSSM
jgi:hypothetical protein